MKILIATGLYPPEIGGPATYSKILKDQLPKHGFSVVVLPFSTVRKFPKFIRHIIFFVHILRLGYGKDYIVSLDPVSVGLPAALASAVLRKKHIIKISGDYAWEQLTERYGIYKSLEDFSKNNSRRPFPINILSKVECFVAKDSEAIIVPSKYLKGIVEKWGIKGEKIHVIHNSVKDLNDQGNVEILRSLIRFDGKVIMSAGRLIPLKRFDMLVRLMPVLVERFGNIKLFIAGDGPEKEKLESLAKELGVENEVVFSGSLEQEVLFRYIKISDVFVLNSTHETFPHILLEVLSIGRPAIATRAGGNPEIIEDGKSGILVSSGDEDELEKSISKVLSNKSYAQRLSVGGRRRAEVFSEKRAIDEFISLLKRYEST
ncbi:hypothetical protein CL631_02695 [bacterium]|jgi:glycosyltransferase involved in cell wall biosynthesis|nr:hypothetical protein [bacterium]MDP6659893.1 glycosyltransferase family 4 protein [Candidatus Paceibacterota bacterium]|tara:strand:- start:48108 stop:49229 length:1122 start_codon:yes stop_codon:yes gene_type:complete